MRAHDASSSTKSEGISYKIGVTHSAVMSAVVPCWAARYQSPIYVGNPRFALSVLASLASHSDLSRLPV